METALHEAAGLFASHGAAMLDLIGLLLFFLLAVLLVVVLVGLMLWFFFLRGRR